MPGIGNQNEIPSGAEVARLRGRLVALGVPTTEAAQIATASRTRREITDALKSYLATLPPRAR